MNNSPLSRVGKASCNLQDVEDRITDRNLSIGFEDAPEILALHILEGDKMKALILSAEEDPRDVFMIQLGGTARLLVKAPHVFGIYGHFRRKDLESDRPFQLQVDRAHDSCHTTH